MDFLWRQISEEEKEKIRKEAKQIMDNFAKALSKVEKEKAVGEVMREEQTRKEKEPQKYNSDFRKSFFKNAPETDGDFVRAEKGKWK